MCIRDSPSEARLQAWRLGKAVRASGGRGRLAAGGDCPPAVPGVLPRAGGSLLLLAPPPPCG
eukprot:10799859-Alexandrium_andersonii.AAC.1